MPFLTELEDLGNELLLTPKQACTRPKEELLTTKIFLAGGAFAVIASKIPQRGPTSV